MIQKGDNPDGHPELNKYLDPVGGGAHDGRRGWLLATSPDRTEAIVREMRLDGTPGELLLVREKRPDEYPVVVLRNVLSVPKGWTIERTETS